MGTNLHQLTGLCRKGIATATAVIDLGKLNPTTRRNIHKALETGIYNAGSGTGTKIYELLCNRHALPQMTVRKSPKYCWYVWWDVRLPNYTRKAMETLADADKVAFELSKEQHSWTHYYGGMNLYCCSLTSVKSIERLGEVAATYADTPEYKAAVEPVLGMLANREKITIEIDSKV
jgi:hypothetical protein